MAAQAALEPIHSVLCDMLRSGMDFGAAAERCPLAIATEAMRHQCSIPDDDAVTFAKAAPGNRTRSSPGAQNSGNRRRRRPRNNQPNRTPSNSGARNKIKNCCFYFQKDSCSRQQCSYRHICNICGSAEHGSTICPDNEEAS